VFSAACDKVAAGASALAEAANRIDRAEQSPQEGEFGMSPEAHSVVRYWVAALDQRATELKQCMDQAAGLYGLMELAGRRYMETEANNKKGIQNVESNGVDPGWEKKTYDEFSQDPRQLTQPPEDKGGSITQKLRGIEAPSHSGSGDGGSGNGGSSDSSGGAITGGGADDEE
jgi:hypothetical protein